MDVLGYVRVSTTEQGLSGLGLRAQRAAIRSDVDRRGWNLVEVFEDSAASGKSLKGRPGLDEALTILRAGDASGLVVGKLDRLSRSLLDFASLMETSRIEGWSLVALDLGVDTSTPSGEMVANVMATFAQFERRLIGQRTKEALAAKRASGAKLGRPRITSDETVERVKQLRADGLSFRRIADVLNQDGVSTSQGGASWHASTVRAIASAA